jgi:hypothetical protein
MQVLAKSLTLKGLMASVRSTSASAVNRQKTHSEITFYAKLS